jgi:hypothetical protein
MKKTDVFPACKDKRKKEKTVVHYLLLGYNTFSNFFLILLPLEKKSTPIK